MLRIVFTADDLTRVRVAAEPDLLWEIANSVQTLRRSDGTGPFGRWRTLVKPLISHRSPSMTPLASLLPQRGYSPDFLTPACADPADLGTAIETLLGTPRHRLHGDLERLAVTKRNSPAWLGRLATGDIDTLKWLGSAVASYEATAIAPFWRRLRAHIDADRASRIRSMMLEGVEGLLSGLGPWVRWAAPVLEVDYPVDQTLRLEGRGITLQPSFFCWPAPVSLADSSLPPVLVYPIRHDPDWTRPPASARAGGGDPIDALVGRTRAALLRVACEGRTTGELARLLGVSAPAVSQHANVLRAAGMLTTVRDGGRSFHTTTEEGRALLRHSAGATAARPPLPAMPRART